MVKGKIDIVVEAEREVIKTLVESLKPETLTSPSKRGRAKVRVKNGKMFLTIKANSTAALRALFNSYITWIIVVLNTIKEVSVIGREGSSRSSE